MAEKQDRPWWKSVWAVACAFVLVLVLGVGGGLFAANWGGDASPTSGDETTAEEDPAPATSAEDDPLGGVAHACFGGSDPYEGVLAAQEDAPLTEAGAASFTASFVRWQLAVPVDPEMNEKLDQVTTMGRDGALARESAINMEINPTIETQMPNFEDAKYRFYAFMGATVALQMRYKIDIEYTDGTTSQVEMTGGWSLDPSSGQFKMKLSYPEEHLTEILPEKYWDGDTEKVPWETFEGSCDGGV